MQQLWYDMMQSPWSLSTSISGGESWWPLVAPSTEESIQNLSPSVKKWEIKGGRSLGAQEPEMFAKTFLRKKKHNRKLGDDERKKKHHEDPLPYAASAARWAHFSFQQYSFTSKAMAKTRSGRNTAAAEQRGEIHEIYSSFSVGIRIFILFLYSRCSVLLFTLLRVFPSSLWH